VELVTVGGHHQGVAWMGLPGEKDQAHEEE
jgi:hypothetical protein